MYFDFGKLTMEYGTLTTAPTETEWRIGGTVIFVVVKFPERKKYT
jgi:hypothetical protein